MKKFLIFSLFSLFSLLFVGCEAVEPLSYGVKYDPCSSTLSRDNLTVVYGKFNMCGACCEVSDFPSTPQVLKILSANSEYFRVSAGIAPNVWCYEQVCLAEMFKLPKMFWQTCS